MEVAVRQMTGYDDRAFFVSFRNTSLNRDSNLRSFTIQISGWSGIVVQMQQRCEQLLPMRRKATMPYVFKTGLKTQISTALIGVLKLANN